MLRVTEQMTTAALFSLPWYRNFRASRRQRAVAEKGIRR